MPKHTTKDPRGALVVAAEKELAVRSARVQLLRTLDVDIALRAISVFASAEAAADWLIAEGLASLNGKSAVETAQTVKGRQRVLALLGAIEHGVYT